MSGVSLTGLPLNPCVSVSSSARWEETNFLKLGGIERYQRVSLKNKLRIPKNQFFDIHTVAVFASNTLFAARGHIASKLSAGMPTPCTSALQLLTLQQERQVLGLEAHRPNSEGPPSRLSIQASGPQERETSMGWSTQHDFSEDLTNCGLAG